MTVTQSPQQDSLGMLTDKVALVTGGTRGIGAAIGRGLAEEGASVAAGYWRRNEGAEKFRAAMSDEHPQQQFTLHEGNIGLAGDCRRVVREVIDQHGRLDILVNNAGITIDRTVAKPILDQVRCARQRRVVHRGPVRDHADSHAASRRRSSARRHNT